MRPLSHILTILVPLALNAQWVTNGNLHALRLEVSNGVLFASASAEGILRSADSGKTWSPTGFFADGHYAKCNGVVLVGASGISVTTGNVWEGIYRSTDNGLSWTKAHPCSTTCCFAVAGDAILAGTSDGDIYRSTNRGATWQKVYTGLNVSSLAAHGSTILAAQRAADWSEEDSIFRSTDLGSTWQGNGVGYKVFSTSGGTILKATDKCLYRSIDGGLNWEISDSIRNILSISETPHGIFLGHSFGISRSHDNGLSWTPLSTGLPYDSLSLHYESARSFAAVGGIVFASVYHGGLYRTTDGGASWSATEPGLLNVYARCLAACGNRVFVGEREGLTRLTYNGERWIAANTGITEEKVSALAARGNTLFVGTLATIADGGFKCSRDCGESWVTIGSGLSPDDHVESLAIGDAAVFAGTSLGLFRSIDDGESWTQLGPGLIAGDVRILEASDSTVLVSPDNRDIGTILRSTDNGTSWERIDSAYTFGEVSDFAVKDSFIYAVTTNGILRNTKDGSRWTVIDSGFRLHKNGNCRIHCLAVFDSALFAAVDTERCRGLFRSTDNGTSWEAINSGLRVAGSITGLVTTTDRTLFCRTKSGGVWHRPLEEVLGTAVTRPLRKTAKRPELQLLPCATNATNLPFKLSLSRAGSVSMKVYNVKGREVAAIDERFLTAGIHYMILDTHRMGAGHYVARVYAEQFSIVKAFLLFR